MILGTLTPIEAILFGIGAIVVLAGVIQLFLPKTTLWKVALPFTFGVLLLGLGGFGLAFMGPYKEILTVIKPMLENPSPATYAKATETLANGSLSPENAELAKAVLVNRPIPELPEIVEKQAATATDPAGKAALKQVDDVLTAQAKVAEEVTSAAADGTLKPGTLDKFDPGTRIRIAQEIEKSPAVLGKLTADQRQRVRALAKVGRVR